MRSCLSHEREIHWLPAGSARGSVIDPRNFYVGGQSTNCRINALIYRALLMANDWTCSLT